MKQYGVYSKKAGVCETYFKVSTAKKRMKELISQGFDDVSGDITQIWSNGDWEPMGKIELKGSNKTFAANTRQKKPNY